MALLLALWGMGQGRSNLGKEIFGHINDADIFTSLVQDVGRNRSSLGMLNLKPSQIQR